jgi:hypothetical protein
MVVEKQPRSEEEFKPLLDQLAGQLANLPSSEVPFSFFLSHINLRAGRIAHFSKAPFEHDNLPGIGEIGGNLDYSLHMSE